ncbi:MAG: helix-turn-helix transcriptional regulator [Alphaproteobacteria bacterium]|nr:helix-turn-helix transcriptional regulator [Alphaproteobacteria bacterium]
MRKSRSRIDEQVGARVRLRRRALGISQTKLAAALGLSFQMVQRYEYGQCRISVSLLCAVASELDCPIGYFIEGLDDRREGGRVAAGPDDLFNSQYGRSLALFFPRIAQPEGQRVIADLVRAMADDDEAA